MSMPAGKYYVGDLCYVMHPEWSEFCSITIEGEQVVDGEFTLSDGRRFASYCTAYGDGTYEDLDGKSYGVDAGLIGCIALSDIDESELPNVNQGNVIEFSDEFTTGALAGWIRIGHVEIDTN